MMSSFPPWGRRSNDGHAKTPLTLSFILSKPIIMALQPACRELSKTVRIVQIGLRRQVEILQGRGWPSYSSRALPPLRNRVKWGERRHCRDKSKRECGCRLLRCDHHCHYVRLFVLVALSRLEGLCEAVLPPRLS